MGSALACSTAPVEATMTETRLILPVQKYIDLVAEGDASWESHEALKAYNEEA